MSGFIIYCIIGYLSAIFGLALAKKIFNEEYDEFWKYEEPELKYIIIGIVSLLWIVIYPAVIVLGSLILITRYIIKRFNI